MKEENIKQVHTLFHTQCVRLDTLKKSHSSCYYKKQNFETVQGLLGAQGHAPLWARASGLWAACDGLRSAVGCCVHSGLWLPKASGGSGASCLQPYLEDHFTG